MAATPTGRGYWLVASDGGIFNYGDAAFYGSLGGNGVSAYGLLINPLTPGYSLVEANGANMAYGPGTAGIQANAAVSAQQVAIGGGSQGQDCQPTVAPTAALASSLNSSISNASGPGWIGGDGTYSTQLPNGTESFVFSDTLIGTAQANGSSSVTGMPHNSELVGATPNFSTDISGTYGAPLSLVPDTTPGNVWWTGSTYVENGQQLIYVNEFTSLASSSFGVFTGQSGIAALSLQGVMPTFSSITPLPTDAGTIWGSAVVQSGSYTYVYGRDTSPSSNAFLGMKVARVPIGQTLNTAAWTYWNGSQWLAGETNAVPVNSGAVLTGVEAQAGGAGFVAVSIPGGLLAGKSVALSYACSPTGPWSAPQPVYSIPQFSQYPNEYAYMPTFHPEITQQGGLVVSYNLNSTNATSVLQNVHEYQPQFLLLNN